MRQTKKFTEFLEAQIGSFVDCDDSILFGGNKCLCFGVDADVKAPLQHSAPLQHLESELK